MSRLGGRLTGGALKFQAWLQITKQTVDRLQCSIKIVRSTIKCAKVKLNYMLRNYGYAC